MKISNDILKQMALEEDANEGLDALWNEWQEEALEAEQEFYEWWNSCGKFIIFGF